MTAAAMHLECADLIVLLTTSKVLLPFVQLRQLDAWYRDETDRWAAERDQLAKKCAQLEQRHVQFQHELRRKDTEFEKLQKQLAGRLGAAAGVSGSGSSRRSVSRSGSSSSSTQVTGKLTTSSRWA
jgi:4-diphosphocytidyl-2C-methyl-D-erythritol kinase